ncbi:MAG: Crp/Fnr family transcriptional regulator [Nitrospirae bacterium]|nr:Crp/Fnr family transcriptional regulator [Nitrospirota bacterium]
MRLKQQRRSGPLATVSSLATLCAGCDTAHICAVSTANQTSTTADERRPKQGVTMTHYRAGDFIVHQGDQITDLEMICRGLAMQLSVDRQGEESLVRIIGPGGILCLSEWLQAKPTHSASVKAVTDVFVSGLNSEEARACLLQDAATIDIFLRQIGSDVQQLESTAAGLRSPHASARVLQYLLQLASWLHLKNAPTLRFPVVIPRWVIAKATGLRPETVSRVMAQLSLKRLIAYHERRIVIPQWKRLSTAVDAGLSP